MALVVVMTVTIERGWQGTAEEHGFTCQGRRGRGVRAAAARFGTQAAAYQTHPVQLTGALVVDFVSNSGKDGQ